MNIQSILAEAQARADANGDGKLSTHDIETMADDHGFSRDIIAKLKAHADANGDGSISPDDIGQALQNPGLFIDQLKETITGKRN
jgi:uncharacterized protein (DUF2141 family)